MNLKAPFLLLFLLASLNAEISAAKRRVVTGEQETNRFQCEECDYSTNYKHSITAHARTHTGERPFQCQYCDYRAAVKGNITKHERIHTGENLFQCRFCNHRAIKKTDITKHERTHTGEKPFKCEFCDYSTAQKGNLVRHQRTHGNMPVVDDDNFDNNKPTDNLFDELIATYVDDPACLEAVKPASKRRRTQNES